MYRYRIWIPISIYTKNSKSKSNNNLMEIVKLVKDFNILHKEKGHNADTLRCFKVTS